MDKAHSACGHRAHLRARRITGATPEPSDQIRHRKNKGSRGGRPVDFDASDYKNRNVVERAFNHMKTWRGLATRDHKHALGYRAASSSPRSSFGWHDFGDAP